jgi:hypothetical protein
MYDLFGRPVVIPYAPVADVVSGISTAMTAAAEAATIIAAQGAGTTTYVTSVETVNNGTVSTLVALRSGTVEKWRLGAPLGAVAGDRISFPLPLPMNANEPVVAILDTAPGGTVYCSVLGYRA